MKKIFSVVLLLIILFGCKKSDYQVEMVPNFDKDNEKTYFLIDRNQKEPFIIFTEKTNEQLDSIVRRLGRAFKYKIIDGEYNYRLFINENGKLEKFKILTSYDETFDEFLIKDISTWNFGEYSENNKCHKYYFDIKINLLRYTNGSLNGFRMRPVPYHSEDEFLVRPEIRPTIIGGLNSIQNLLKYPEAARRDSIEGKVFVRAFIDTEGNVVDTDVLYGIRGGCIDAAMDAVKKVKFNPGFHKGKPVNVQVTIPILFKLESNKDYAKFSIYITSGSESELSFKIVDFITNGSLNIKEVKTPFEIHYDSLDIGTWLLEQVTKNENLNLRTESSGGNVTGCGRKMILRKDFDEVSIRLFH